MATSAAERGRAFRARVKDRTALRLLQGGAVLSDAVVGRVRITRADGSVEERDPYTPREVIKIQANRVENPHPNSAMLLDEPDLGKAQHKLNEARKRAGYTALPNLEHWHSEEEFEESYGRKRSVQ
jgi:hypothetical protein